MVIAFVMVSVGPSADVIEIFHKLEGMEGVKEIMPLFGEWDFIVKVELEDYSQVGRFVVDRVRAIKGVCETQTYTTTTLKWEEA